MPLERMAALIIFNPATRSHGQLRQHAAQALLAFAVFKAGNLWAGWVGHQSADMIIDNMLSGG